MVAFRQKDPRKLSRLMNEAEYAWSMNLGDCHFAGDGVLQVDLRGDYPEFTADQVATLEKEGYERADTHWYEISPPPRSEIEKRSLVGIFNSAPSSTIQKPLTISGITILAQGEDHTPRLQISFIEALSKDQIKAVQAAGMNIKQIPTVPLLVVG